MFPIKAGGPFGVLLPSILIIFSWMALKLLLRSLGAVKSCGGGPTGAGRSTFCADFERYRSSSFCALF